MTVDGFLARWFRASEAQGAGVDGRLSDRRFWAEHAVWVRASGVDATEEQVLRAAFLHLAPVHVQACELSPDGDRSVVDAFVDWGRLARSLGLERRAALEAFASARRKVRAVLPPAA